MDFFKFNEFDYNNKSVAIRVDLNLPYNSKTKKLSETIRLREHVKTIKELQNRNARIVVLAHQGRKGKEDFISLEKHVCLLEKYLGKVKFIKFGENFDQVRKMKEGEIILLDNVRFYDDETEDKDIVEHSKSKLTGDLAPYIDYFILDAFSVAHRNHASVVGFSSVKPCICGPVFENELKNLEEFVKKLENSKSCFILGGAKPKEPVDLIKNWIEKDVNILTTGIISLLFLTARGYKLGETENFLIEKGYFKHIDEIKKLDCDKIKTPIDLGILKEDKRTDIPIKDMPVEERILDIGKNTVKYYKKLIDTSKVVCMKGTAGVYEKKNFEFGTKKLFDFLGKNSLIGGGNTTDALEKLKINFGKFGYVSLGGGAFVEFLCKKKLPGIEGLENSKKIFGNIL